MHIHVITLFPEMFGSPLGASIPKRAQESGALHIFLWNLRDFAPGKHRETDDTPYGGGPGMIMKIEPIAIALEAVCDSMAAPWRVLLSPQGRRLDHALARRLASHDDLVLVCGRYEGVDARVATFVDEEVSIGDFVLSGGELPALVLIDTLSRLVPGALGHPDSATEESFSDGLLEYPQYTRPEEFHGQRVPDVLLSGDHARVARWRRRAALLRTRDRRPDLLDTAKLSEDDRRALDDGASTVAAPSGGRAAHEAPED